MKKYAAMTAVLLSLALVLGACTNDDDKDTSSNTDTDSDANNSGVTSQLSVPMDITYKDEDLDDSYSSDSAVKINLNGQSAEIDGSGASADGSAVTISSAGTYLISGSLSDGQIIVDTDKKTTVRLVFDGVDITCSDSAPVYVKSADKTIITLAPGSENILTDGESYTYDSEEDNEPNACLFSKDDLTLNGSGSLTINANFNNGITTKDDLVITGGTYHITAVHNGIRGKDSVCIRDGNFTIDAGADGIKSNQTSDGTKGYISLDGGNYDITAVNDGVQTETVLQITAGSFAISTGGGSQNASTDSSGKTREAWGRWDNDRAENQQAANDDDEDGDDASTSAKGLKSDADIYISDGTFYIDSSDDALHSNGNIRIDNGTYTILSGDDGMHADTKLTINDAVIDIQKSYEGLEGSIVEINGGTIDIVASDDGINAAGGSDSSGTGRPGEGGFSAAESSDMYISINGGEIEIDSGADGLDSNGDIYMSGGTVVINAPSSGVEVAIDYDDGTFELTGGVIMAAGTSGMAQMPGSTSSQPSVMVNYDSSQQGTVTVTDSSGNEVMHYTPTKSYQNIVFTAPELEIGESYTLTSGSVQTSFTIESVVTSVAQDGSAYSGGMGGAGGMGGSPGGNRGGGTDGDFQRPDGDGKPDGEMPDMPNGGFGGTPPDDMEGF